MANQTTPVQLEFGIGLPRPDDVASGARNAEALGFDFVTTGEHVSVFFESIGKGFLAV